MPVNSRNLKPYPSVPIEPIPAPPPGRATEFRSAQLALWKRVTRSARLLSITIGCAVVAVVLFTVAPGNGFAGFIGVLLAIVGGATLLPGAGGLIRTARMWRLMNTDQWTVYTVNRASLYRTPPTMTLMGDDNVEYPIALFGATASVRGLMRPEVWFVGDPRGRGILTVAGGGEILRTRPRHVRGTPATRPVKKQSQAARAAAHRAKVQAKAKARADQRRANPPSLRQPAKPTKPRRFPRRGGQKIKWQ
jgi:hypothetical protein